MKHFADLLLNKNNSKSNDQVPFIQRRRGIEIKSSREINLMKKSSRIVGTVLREINDLIKPGMSTKDLDDFAEKRIRELGAVPSFKGYHGFPASICSSINNEVVHGIPNKNKIIKDGDLVKIDTGAYIDGFHGDSCISICVGEVSKEAKKLSDVAHQALFAGLSKIKSGNTLLDIAGAIEDVVRSNGFSVVEDYTGHGVGRNLHEEPSVFNLSEVNKAGAKFNWEKLNWINSQYIKKMETILLTKTIKKYWNDMGWESPSTEWDLKLTNLIQDSMILLKDAIDQSRPFFSLSPMQKEGKEFLKSKKEAKESLSFTLFYLKEGNISKVTKDIAEEIINKITINHSIKKGIIMKSLRVAFFGCLSGPDLIQSWELFSENKIDIPLIERCLI